MKSAQPPLTCDPTPKSHPTLPRLAAVFSSKLGSLFCCGLGVLLLAACAPTPVEVPVEQAEVSNPNIVRISTAGIGSGNYGRIGYWLADSLLQDSPGLSIFLEYRANLTGRGFRDRLLMLANRELEVVVVNSNGVSAMAANGRGLFDAPIPLRALAAVPEHDWCVFVVDAALGINSFADIRDRQFPLRLATGYLDGDSAIGFLAGEVLRRHGIEIDQLEEWGGNVLTSGPRASRDAYAAGDADAVYQEAAFPEFWAATLPEKPAVFLSLEPEVARAIEEDLGVTSMTVPANTYPGQEEPLLALDFSSFVIGVRDDMDEDLAYRMTRLIIERRAELDRTTQFGSINVVPGLNLVLDPYAIDPQTAWQTSIPLHPGAARYYRENGLME